MRPGLRIILIVFFSLSIIGLLIMFSIISKVPECPGKLPDEYYACSNDFDCAYNPVFECMNRDKTYNCNPDPAIVRRRQEISNLLACVCENNKCKTVFNQGI